ncbi:MAG: DUF393 domain-containing protein [Candidatus Omnitrophica bacterium]|nr:DUF393 domain-containing protein [Candidatus Omnitrophota bacterium]
MRGFSTASSSSMSASVSVAQIRRWVGLTVLGLAGVWVVFAQLVAPQAIQAAYHGEGASVLSHIIRELGQPLDELLWRWGMLTQAVVLGCLGLWLLVWVTTSPGFFKRFVGEATPGTLGAIRMLTCGILLLHTLWEGLASTALLPREMINTPGGIMRVLALLPIGFERFLANETALGVFQWVTGALLFLGAIGWRTRITVPLGAVGYLLMGGIFRLYAWFYHTGVIPVYVMAVLSLTPCGDGWSVDRLRKVARGAPVPPADRATAVYGWARYACWVVIALPYLAAGMSKLRNSGLTWWNATNMRIFLYRDTLNPMGFESELSLRLTSAPDAVFAVLGLVGLLAELVFVSVLFSRWARRILPFVAAGMHAGIFLLQNILFLDLMLLQLAFIDWTRIRTAAGRWLEAHRGTLEVLYDGQCPLCVRSVRLLGPLDLFNRLRWIDFRTLNLTDYNAGHGVRLTSSELEQAMAVVSRRRTRQGFKAWRAIAQAIPAGWLVAPWLYVPGIPWLGERVYRRVAQSRHKLFKCDAACAHEGEAAQGLAPQPRRAPNALRGPLVVSASAIVLLLCWIYRVEEYPLTALQMYTKPTTGIAEYYKVLAHRASGETATARIKEAIPAMTDGRYRRVIRMCFKPDQVQVCEKFLAACGAAFNAQARAGERVTHLEIQKWAWDVRANPSDPEHGRLADRFLFSLESKKSVEAQTLLVAFDEVGQRQ